MAKKIRKNPPKIDNVLEKIRTTNRRKSAPAQYNELGFPIMIIDPIYITFQGEKILDINPKEIMEAAFLALLDKPARLSGAELRFLRLYMNLTQKAFARIIGTEDDSLISKWESKKQGFTGMDTAKELVIRMRCKLYHNSRDRIGNSYLDNMLSGPLSTKTVGEPIRLCI